MGISYTQPAARLTDVTRVFPNGTVAIERTSLELAPDEMVALVGPSGCGKSTLLRMLAGLDAPTTGSVESAASHVGYVFQDATLLPWLTALQNVTLPLRLAGRPRREANATAREALKRVGLADYEKLRPAQLSGGMRMRVSIARALTESPEVFLFDEPFGALDEITRQKLNEELDQLMAQRPFCGVFVTHAITEAVFLADRVVVFSARPGSVIADIRVPFARPRPASLRYSTEFADLCRQLSDALAASSLARGEAA
ncbi:NitT/TauT family transport system ATP-binding protein [Jatrophihabitans sp. GAS493]|uniref:ABC transporter ATP-binding protein n=1 Tax=Jatrophihabitans sp. GAS493 TaxID=1907575 RepID=UPI000BB992C2|nr:ABC transporter ATP-binding protein [Jatrophihabitans sp. GAS493]SOD70775.1 NitT/TauT family transport system ATP-binding protein [Jatrophihabitans sp. GAS493]